MDRRTHDRLAEPLPEVGQGLGVPQPQGARLLAPRFNPPHAAKTLQSNLMFPDRLLEKREACQDHAWQAENERPDDKL